MLAKQNLIRKKLPKFASYFLILFSPISIYFYLFPIYQGDIFDLGQKPKTTIQFSTNKKLVVFALPDCPYCHESRLILEKLLKRNPSIQIEIWICGNQFDSYYSSIESKNLKIIQFNEFDKTIYLTEGVFPTYVITENRKLVKRWTNRTFGARSLDELEAFFEVHK
jgi:glutaredoxin